MEGIQTELEKQRKRDIKFMMRLADDQRKLETLKWQLKFIIDDHFMQQFQYQLILEMLARAGYRLVQLPDLNIPGLQRVFDIEIPEDRERIELPLDVAPEEMEHLAQQVRPREWHFHQRFEEYVNINSNLNAQNVEIESPTSERMAPQLDLLFLGNDVQPRFDVGEEYEVRQYLSALSSVEANSSCVEANSSCVEANSSCVEENSSCVEANSSCFEENSSCVEANSSSVEENSSCVEANSSCVEENSSCVERESCRVEVDLSCAEAHSTDSISSNDSIIQNTAPRSLESNAHETENSNPSKDCIDDANNYPNLQIVLNASIRQNSNTLFPISGSSLSHPKSTSKYVEEPCARFRNSKRFCTNNEYEIPASNESVVSETIRPSGHLSTDQYRGDPNHPEDEIIPRKKFKKAHQVKIKKI